MRTSHRSSRAGAFRRGRESRPASAEELARITGVRPGGADLATVNLMAAFAPIGARAAPVWLADGRRHLICWPYGLPELHAMAEALGIGRRWFHPGRDGRHPHYDIPREREAEILARCTLVRPRDILWVIRGGAWPRPGGAGGEA